MFSVWRYRARYCPEIHFDAAKEYQVWFFSRFGLKGYFCFAWAVKQTVALLVIGMLVQCNTEKNNNIFMVITLAGMAQPV